MIGGYVFKTLKAAGKFDKVIEGIVKIKSNAKQLITNGLTRANNFIQGISIPFTGWIKDAFGSIISKAKGFVTDVFQKYGPKPNNSTELKYKLDIQLFAKKDLKMVNDAAKEVGIDRNMFGEYIHEIKYELGMKASNNFTYKESLEMAEELKKSTGGR